MVGSLQIKRTETEASAAGYVPLDGELIVVKEPLSINVGDGVTPGGKSLVKQPTIDFIPPFPDQLGKENYLLTTDGSSLQWKYPSYLEQDPVAKTAAFTAVSGYQYNVSVSSSYNITLPPTPLDRVQIRIQNLNQSCSSSLKIGINPNGKKINNKAEIVYLQEPGIDVLLTYLSENDSWATDMGGTTSQNILNTMSGSVYWKFNTVNNQKTYSLSAPVMPHSDKELYSVMKGGEELLPADFSINQTTNTITLTVAPTSVQPVKVRCWIKHETAGVNSSNVFPSGFIGLFEPLTTVDTNVWELYPRGDVIGVTCTTNYPIDGGIRGVTILNDGRIAVVGGHNYGVGYCNDCYLGTVDSNLNITWVKCVTPYPVSNGYVHCTTLNNGKILAACGYPNGTLCYLGTVGANNISWSATTAYPIDNYDGQMVKLLDGRSLYIGAYAAGTIHNACYFSNINGAGWVAGTPYPRSVCAHAATVLSNGNVLVCCGITAEAGTAVAESFIGKITTNSNTISWTPAPTFPLGGTQLHTMGTIGNKVLCLGGNNTTEGWVTSVVVGDYSPVSNTLAWTITNRKGIFNLTNNTRLVNLTPTKLLAIGGDYDGSLGTPVNTSKIFEIQNSYIKK